MSEQEASYRPSAFYWRKQIREAETIVDLRETAMLLCSELEQTKAWIRERGMIPPKFIVPVEEAEAKQWEID